MLVEPELDVAAFTEARPKLYGTEFTFEAYLGVPLVAGGEFVGTLELAHYQAGAYKPSNAGLLSLIWLSVH